MNEYRVRRYQRPQKRVATRATLPCTSTAVCQSSEGWRKIHLRDCLKYLVLTLPEPAFKTAKEIAAEAVKPLAEQGDLTSALIRYQQKLAEQEVQYRPATFRKYRR